VDDIYIYKVKGLMSTIDFIVVMNYD
jgi:hypothetical protein